MNSLRSKRNGYLTYHRILRLTFTPVIMELIMKKYVILLALLASTACTDTSFATGPTTELAQPQQYKQGIDRRSFEFALPPALKLTPAQVDTITVLRTRFDAQYASEVTIRRTVLEQVRTAKEAGTSRDEIAKILRGYRDTAQALRKGRMQLNKDIFAVLTPEQKRFILTRNSRINRL